MGIRHGDLMDTVVKNISIDEFEPKTGDLREVSTIGFYVTERSAGHDLYNFIQQGYSPVRDVELTPNPTEDGYYMVFVELDRKDDLVSTIDNIITDITNIAGDLDWHFKTHVMDDYIRWADRSDGGVMIDPETFMNVDEYIEHQEQQRIQEAEEARVNEIIEFFQHSDLADVTVEGDTLTISRGGDSAVLEMVGFGNAPETMQAANLTECPLDQPDNEFRRFQGMLGGLNAMPINGHIVLFYPDQDKIMITRPQ